MRFLMVLIIILLLTYALWPEQEIPPVEETFIGDQIRPLRKAEKFQQEDYLEALDKHRADMDRQEADDQ